MSEQGHLVSYLHSLKNLVLFLCNVRNNTDDSQNPSTLVKVLIENVHEKEPDWERHGPEGTARPDCPIPSGAAGPIAAWPRPPGAPVTTWHSVGERSGSKRTHLWWEMADLLLFIASLFFHQVGKSSGWRPRPLWSSWIILPHFKVNGPSWYILAHVIFLHSWPCHSWKNKIKNGTFITNT